MNQSETVDILQRMRALELRLARTRAFFALILLGSICVITLGMSQNAARVVKAQRFVLVDEGGKELAVLGYSDTAFGLYFHARTPKDESPLIAIEVESMDGAPELEEASLTLRGEVRPTTATIRSYYIGLRNEEDDQSISLDYFKSPSLNFRDESGFPYISLGHTDKGGAEFTVSAPLHIKGAMQKAIRADLEGRPTDPQLNEAYKRSFRFQLAAPPFSDPSMRLLKDGRTLWKANTN